MYCICSTISVGPNLKLNFWSRCIWKLSLVSHVLVCLHGSLTPGKAITSLQTDKLIFFHCKRLGEAAFLELSSDYRHLNMLM